MASNVITMFDQLAAEYDSRYQRPLGSLADTLEREAVFALARRGARVTAVDASAPMLSLTRKKAHQGEQ